MPTQSPWEERSHSEIEWWSCHTRPWHVDNACISRKCHLKNLVIFSAIRNSRISYISNGGLPDATISSASAVYKNALTPTPLTTSHDQYVTIQSTIRLTTPPRFDCVSDLRALRRRKKLLRATSEEESGVRGSRGILPAGLISCLGGFSNSIRASASPMQSLFDLSPALDDYLNPSASSQNEASLPPKASFSFTQWPSKNSKSAWPV